jgi:NAD(P)-dependent dehydrogenase (short-subunit alcohol dehydrogenase family)
MPAVDSSQLLRPGLLRDVSMLLARAASPVAEEGAAAGACIAGACAALGAHVCECELAVDAGLAVDDTAIEHAADDAVERTLAGAGGIELLVVDGASVFERAGVEARDALRACLDASWNVTRTVAERAFLAGGHGGRIVYLAPRAGGAVHADAAHADAARAGLENLARTLSIEWARHGVTAVTIAPGAAPGTTVATVVGYLASPAGAYFSGCLLDLSGV